MTPFIGKQSELSAASAVFYFFGGVVSVFAVTTFYNETNKLNLLTVGIGVLALVTSIVFVTLGRRARLYGSLVLMCVSGALVLLLIGYSTFEMRSVSSGLLFYTFFIYLAWFGPMRVARIFSYTWLVIYCVLMSMKFGTDVSQFLLTLTLTAVMLGELVGTYKRRLELTSITDALCGIWNKRGFDQIMVRSIQVAHRTGQPLSILFFDLDNFKQINDVRGHHAGDQVLQEFVAQIERNTRPQDTLARLGGDEFILVMPNTDALQADATADRLSEAVRVAEWSYGSAEMITGESVEALVSRADQRLLENKRFRKSGSPEPGWLPG